MQINRVLIVDDNGLRAETLSLSLQNMGLETDIARDAAQVQKTAEMRRPDLYIIDVSVAHGQGYAITRDLSQRGAAHDIAILLLVGDSNPQALDAQMNYGLQVGATQVLSKPLDLGELKKTIAQLQGLAAPANELDGHGKTLETLERAPPKLQAAKQKATFTDPSAVQISERLAQYLGPIAVVMVRKNAQKATSLFQLCQLLAEHIDHPKKKFEFLAWAKEQALD